MEKEMKIITLTKGKFAIVDDEDFDLVNKYNWHCTHGYAASRPHRHEKHIYMHRLILGILTSSKLDVDHINHNSLDNRKCNLRVCTRAQNMMNSLGYDTSKYKGICWRDTKKKWTSQIKFNGKQYYLGIYETAEEAAHAYDRKATELFGEYCSLNFPRIES